MTNIKEYIQIIEDKLKNSEKSQERLLNNDIIEIDLGTTVIEVLNKIASKWNELSEENKQEVAVNIGGVYNLASTLTFFNNYKL